MTRRSVVLRITFHLLNGHASPESMQESESESEEEDTEDSESSEDSSSDEGTAEDDHSPAEVDGGCCNGIHESPHQPPS